MPAKLPIEEIVKRIKDIHGDTIILDETTYTNTCTKARFIDKDFGEFWSRPKEILKGKTNKERGKIKYTETLIEKYGVDNPSKVPGVREKAKQTMVERYGEDYAVKNAEKAKQTMVERYGIDHFLKTDAGKEKQRLGVQEKYGVDNVSQALEIKEKKRISSQKKYGVDFVFQAQEIKDKIRQIVTERYGGMGLQSPKLAQKIRNTNLEKYGVSNPMQNKNVKRKAIETNLEKYGTEHPLQNKEVMKKLQATNLERYGNICSFHGKEQQKKARATCLKNYGVLWPTQSKVVMRKVQETNLERYGVPWTQQNKEIALKTARSSNNSTVLKHWLTREDVVCVASFEIKTVKYFNANKINYEWQHQTFTMPDGRTYRPDCYLPDMKKWVEIKGYFWEDAQEKWEWFHNKYPNSELWDETKLKRLEIVS